MSCKPYFESMSNEMLPDILIIETQSYPVSWSVQLFKDCLKKKYLCRVLKINKKIVGYFIVQKILDEFHLLNLCVSPDRLGQKLGRLQLDKVINTAKSQGMNRILLEVRRSSKAARNLYKSSEFHRIGIRKNYYPSLDGREDAIVMERPIS